MRYRELINDEEFLKEKNKLKESIEVIQKQIRGTEDRSKKWTELTERVFDFACEAQKVFKNGDLETKRSILSSLGQNYTLKDKKLFIVPYKWLEPIIVKKNDIDKRINWEELEKASPDKTKEAFASYRPLLRSRPDLNRQPPA